MDDTVPGARAALEQNATRALPARRRLFADEIRYADSGVAPEEDTLAERDGPAGWMTHEGRPAEHGRLTGGDASRLEIAHEGWFGGQVSAGSG